MPMPPLERLLRMKEVAARVGISYRTLMNQRTQHRFPLTFVKPMGVWVIREAEVDEYIRSIREQRA